MSRPLPELLRRVPEGATLRDTGAILDRFMDWVASTGVTPYPHQEEALLELASSKHVVLDTPTGSGKSLVALGLHFKGLCEGRRSFYTAPIKALVSEKFFTLIDLFGAENVGMLTGDASINWAAPIICCTAEVLSNMSLRQGERTDAPYVVMDEFHYYGDRERGVAWQVPLLTLPHSTFLLMSATLGNTAHIEERLKRETGRDVAHVWSDHRPVPLDYEYRETSIQETIEELLDQRRAPVYVVNFTQRECAELAQALTSARVATREQRAAIGEALGEFKFDTPYGKDLKRFFSHGVGVHHAGLLPKYRLLVEQLAQQGHLRVICGTDTLGVGVNIPIRTVLLTRLSKFDGEKVRMLQAREFRQITGRAGRRGFDIEGSVVAQAPEQAIERKRREEKGKGKRKGGPAARPFARPGGGPNRELGWTADTFDELIKRPPERLVSQFRVDVGMLFSVLQREGGHGGYAVLGDLIVRCHESEARKRRIRREAAVLFRSLRRSGIVTVEKRSAAEGGRVHVNAELQRDFNLYQSLSLYLVEAIAVLDPEAPSYALELLSLVEAVIDDPVPILRAQVRKLRGELIGKLKAEGVPYEERQDRLAEVTHPKPNEEFIEQTFAIFAEGHPWVGRSDISPKSIAREMVEGFQGFDSYVRQYELQRVEGLLLRYLGNVYSVLMRNVADARKTDDVLDVLAYLRTMIARVDSSLLEEWESLLHPSAVKEAAAAEPAPRLDLALTPKAFRARVRSELHALVRALAEGDYEEAARWVRQDPDDAWDAARFERELAPFLAEHGRVSFNAEARKAHYAVLKPTGPRTWDVAQSILDPTGDESWALEGEIDLRGEKAPEGPLVRLRRIGA